MTRKERMRTAMTGGVPDCVPVMPQICHPHAIRAMGLPYERTLTEVLTQPHRMSELVLACARLYDVDGFRAFLPWDPLRIVEDDGEAFEVDAEGRRTGRVDFRGGGWVVPFEEEPLIKDDADLDRLEVPTHEAFLQTPAYRAIGQIVTEAGDDFFVASAPTPLTVEFLTIQRGKENALVDLTESPDFAKRIIEKGTAIAIQQAMALCEAGVDGLMIADVFGGIISPRHFQEFCLPHMARFVDALKPYGLPIYLHICGNSTGILEMMADTGVDCIEPLDPLGGVEVADAKRRVGDRVGLMGGVNTVTLAHGSFQAAVEDCARCLREGADRGGYILACGDMLPTETSAEKVKAMVRSAHEYGY